MSRIFKNSLVPSNFVSVASTGVLNKYMPHKNGRVKRLCAVVGTAIVSSGSVVLTFYRRPTANGTGSQVSLGTITIPAGTAAGKCYYKDINPVNIKEGEELSVECSTAAAGGGAAGAAQGLFEVNEDPEADGNNSNMVASA